MNYNFKGKLNMKRIMAFGIDKNCEEDIIVFNANLRDGKMVIVPEMYGHTIDKDELNNSVEKFPFMFEKKNGKMVLNYGDYDAERFLTSTNIHEKTLVVGEVFSLFEKDETYTYKVKHIEG